jgi:uncharacterized protein YcbX
VTSQRLEEIWVYPVKGAAGISVREWPLDELGLAHDRRWMVVDADGHFRSQRTDPALCRVAPAIVGDALRLDAPGMPSLALPLEGSADSATREVRIWSDDVLARASREGSEWFRDLLQGPCTLVHLPTLAARACDPRIARGSRVGFADAFPLLLVSLESLADLNSRLERPVPMNRFRPNLVVRAGSSYAEDEWTEFRVDGLEFRAVKPCVRCVVVTVDQSTGEAGSEPLRTLSTYRRSESGVTFGQNVVHLERGTIHAFSSVEPMDSGW